MTDSFLITAAEVFCPVGLNVVQAATSMYTGIARVEASSLMDDRFDAITMGLVPEDVMAPIDESIQATPFMTAHTVRMLKLLSPCLENLSAAGVPTAGMPLLIAGPSETDRAHGTFVEGFFDHLLTQSGVAFDTGRSALYLKGGAGFFFALQDARLMLEGGASHVLVGGVDSLLDPMDLSRYMMEKRLNQQGVMDGFTPGEGAALIVLSRPGADPFTDNPLAAFLGVGLGEEKGHRYSDDPYKGEGLATSVTSLFNDVDKAIPKVNTVFAGFNGESFNAKEWGVSFMRNSDRIEEAHHVEHPAEYIGDARAALSPIMTAVGAYGMANGMWQGPMLVWGASDDAPRGCALLNAVSTP